MKSFRLPERNTRFALPIVCPQTGEHISAETLYNRTADAMGRAFSDHIGDLVFDNLDYDAKVDVCGTDESNTALHDAIYAWADGVREQLKLAEAGVTIPNIPHASVIEARIVGRLVADLLAAGLSIDVWNGGDEPEIKECTDAAVIFATLGASDQDELTMTSPDGYAGWIRLVWGNDDAVISDYSTRLEVVMRPANKLAEDLGNGETESVVDRPRTTARFWFFARSGIVLIKMREGQELSWAEGGLTDDGFSYTGHHWRFEGGGIHYTSQTNARDCDGPISYGHQAFCPLDALKANEYEGTNFPRWKDNTGWQRDANAEAAGY